MNEEAIIQALRNLDVSVQVTKRDNRYVWQCLEGNGTANDLASAMSAALNFMIKRLAGPVTLADLNRDKNN